MLSYLMSFEANIEKLKDKVQELNDASQYIGSLADAEIRNGKKIILVVERWLGKARGTIAKASQLFDDVKYVRVGCMGYSFYNLLQIYRLSREAESITNIIANLLEAGRFDTIGYDDTINNVGFTSAASHFIKFKSRIPIMNEIIWALADHKISIIGVYGLGGTGKSTLVEQVARMAQRGNLFSKVVKASVTQSPDLARIQGELAYQLGLEFTEANVVGRANRLRERIKRENNILIILDDIQAAIKLEELGISFMGNINLEERENVFGNYHLGCKVLLVSRNQHVLNDMETQKDFKLDVLSEHETWDLFVLMAGDVGKDTGFHSIAREVAKKCLRLPIIVIIIARALKNKRVPIWEDALNKLSRVNNKELHEFTYSALELSYNQLESDEAKALFLLCGVVGPRFLIKDLLKYVVGLGIFKDLTAMEDARSKLYEMISSLKDSYLLIEDKDTSVEFIKMHDIVHEIAILIAARDEYAFIMKRDFELKQWLTTDLLRQCPGIILHRCIIQKLLERFEEDEGNNQKVLENIILSDPMHVIEHPVGLTSRARKVISLLDLQSGYEVNIVGICGTCGIGKSTIARAVYYFIANFFQGSCFLGDVRENTIMHGLIHMQETLLSEILGKNDIKVGHVNKGISIIKTRLGPKRVLLILDNVDKLMQLQSLAGGLDWFGPGSRIIITTREKDLLYAHGVQKIYDVEELNHEEALELFTWNAFKGKKMYPSYMDISKQIVINSNGLPLALEIVGSKLFGKSVEEWNTLFEDPRRKVKEVFQASYNRWDENEKEIFIDVMTQAALSSHSLIKYGFYDVFLCFKGDTRYNFTGHLYHALQQKGMRTFMDEKLKGGEEISPTLCKAIEESRSAIIVFSKNFAFSTWCLNELVKILECKKGKDQLVFPLFYDVEPSEVRHQLGSYEKAFAKHEERFKYDMEKLQKWRLSLYEVANLSGWNLKYGCEYEYEFVQRIVKHVATKIN